MELNCEHFRVIFFYNFRRTYRWYGEFNRGHSSLQGEFSESRPKSVVVPETNDAVSQLITQDLHVTYREFETTLGISGTSIHSILHEHLTVKETCSCWIPHNLGWSKEMLQMLLMLNIL